MKLLTLLPVASLLLSSCEHSAKVEVPPPTVIAPSPTSAAGGLVAGEAFLQQNGKKPGVVTTASGLQYRIISSGSPAGRSPTRSDSVRVHYHGTLVDGTVFDSSIERGIPAVFGVGQVIAGWTEALQLMKPGDRWQVFIPARLAYGERAMGEKIPANSTLIFEVDLLEVGGAG